METLKEKIARVVREQVEVVPYDPAWPQLFEAEKAHLLKCLPNDLITRIEHYGSTAVPGLSAKPIVDMLIEVTSLEAVKERIVPVLEAQGYDYFWRPSFGDDIPPFYAWFIKRDGNGCRTHHLHMVKADFAQWDALYFRDYLRVHPDTALEYQNLKLALSTGFKHDRVAYTKAKTEFVLRITRLAIETMNIPD